MQNKILPSESATEITPQVRSSVTLNITQIPEMRPATQQVDALYAEMRHTTRRRKKQYWASNLIQFVLLPLGGLFGIIRQGASLTPFTLTATVTLFAAVLVCWNVFNYRFFFSKSARLNADALVKAGGNQAIPALLDVTIGFKVAQDAQICVLALTQLLPQLQASDAPLLTPRHRKALNTILKLELTGGAYLAGYSAAPTYALAILKAYEQVGDARALEIVEQLAGGTPFTDRQRTIHQAALDCLPLLQAHVSGIETTQTLLRASMPETNTPDTLLRAATFTTNFPNDELLRATNPHDAPPSP